jgi:hypothetical protein
MLCACGCGQETSLAKSNATKPGYVKGQPMRYVVGHNGRKSFVEYVVEDRGYETPCWIWQKALTTAGYGTMYDENGKTAYAHIVFHRRKHGPIPKGAQLHHVCGVRSCVNPDHTVRKTAATHSQADRAKLTADDVREARALFDTGQMRVTELARKYDVSSGTISRIVRRLQWRNVV